MEEFVVSARKYRPQTFKDVVGQQAITNTLLNAIETNHLASALLFTGPRGVGKTTCARILARKINQPGYDDPTEEFAFNVFELDAASNNSVDDIRNLIDQVRIPPQTGQYKVYVIDEVHMLSSAAFNAFLKTLEEPPKHAIFILATTEKHKIIPTILSRCQIFDFKRITVKDAKEHLMEVAKSQGINYEDDALHIIAQKADGAMRDALSIFDRVVSYCGTNLTRQAVTENLNVLDYETYIEVTDLILENNIPEVLISFNEILSKGFDGHHFIAGLASHFRDLLVSKTPSTLRLLEAGEQAQKSYSIQSLKASQEFLMQGIDLANSCDLKYKTSQNQRLLVELCLMQLASITFDGEKKVNGYIIPPSHFFSRVLDIDVAVPEIIQVETPKTEVIPVEITSKNEVVSEPKVPVSNSDIPQLPKVSALSLSSIRAKRELEKSKNQAEKEYVILPTEPFSETDMLMIWTKFAENRGQKGQKIIEALLLLNDPKLEGTTIIHELPNEGAKLEFETVKYDLTGTLRGKLHNHDITIEVIVNEDISSKRAFTPQDRYNRLNEINPNLDVLRKLFDLHI